VDAAYEPAKVPSAMGDEIAMLARKSGVPSDRPMLGIARSARSARRRECRRARDRRLLQGGAAPEIRQFAVAPHVLGSPHVRDRADVTDPGVHRIGSWRENAGAMGVLPRLSLTLHGGQSAAVRGEKHEEDGSP
jgi:hypothetical protein